MTALSYLGPPSARFVVVHETYLQRKCKVHPLPQWHCSTVDFGASHALEIVQWTGCVLYQAKCKVHPLSPNALYTCLLFWGLPICMRNRTVHESLLRKQAKVQSASPSPNALYTVDLGPPTHCTSPHSALKCTL
jgi:hypothetical protein